MKLPLILAAVLATSLSAQAATLLSFDFESNSFSYYYGYTYQQTGTGSFANNNGNPTAGAGRLGTAGALTTFNTTGSAGDFAGFGTGFGANPANANAISSASALGDFSFTIDVRSDGLTGASAGVEFEIKFEAPDNSILPGDGGTETDVLLGLRFNRTVTSTYQTFATTLADWTVYTGSLATLKSNLGTLNNINFNIAHNSNGAYASYGNDANNVLAADNYTLSVVPEAGTATLGLLAIGGLLARRRR